MSRVPIPDDWDGETWACHLLEWPDSDQYNGILLGLLTWPLRGWFWDERTGQVADAQAVGMAIYDRIQDSEGTMICFDEVVAAINALGNASASGCCGGSGGAGLWPATGEAFTDDGTAFPDGYADRPEYSVAKCNLAARLLADLAADFRALKAVQVAGISSLALSAALGVLMLTPLALSGVLEATIAALALVGVGVAVFVTACDELADRIDAIDICEVYGASTAAEALANIEAWIDAGTYTTSTLTEALGKALVSEDAVNPLFGELGSLAYDPSQLPAGDCDLCDDCPPTMVWGTGDPSSDGYMDAELVSSGQWQVHFYIPVAMAVDISELSGWTEYTGGTADTGWMESYRHTDCGDGTFPGWDHESEADPPPAHYDVVTRLKITSQTEFSVYVEFSEVV